MHHWRILRTGVRCSFARIEIHGVDSRQDLIIIDVILQVDVQGCSINTWGSQALASSGQDINTVDNHGEGRPSRLVSFC